MDAAEIATAFKQSNVNIEDNAILYFQNMCKEHGLTASKMAEEWDLYSMNQNVSNVASLDTLQALNSKLLMKNKNKENHKSKESHKTPVSSQRRKGKSIYGVELLKSPKIKQQMDFASPNGTKSGGKLERINGLFSPTSISSPGNNGTAYENREKAGQTVDEYNSFYKDKIKSCMGQHVTQVVVNTEEYDNVGETFEYMYTSLPARMEALEDQLVEAEERFKKELKLSELGVIGDPSPSQVSVVGRICCEAAEGKINSKSITLEGSKQSCGGMRVLLDLSEIESYSMFPGKILAMEGIYNEMDQPMVVKKIYPCTPAPMPLTKHSILYKNDTAMDVDDAQLPLRVMVASGPYTPTTDAQFLPYSDLLEICAVDQPDVLILMGPFIDATHNSFQDGIAQYDDMNMSFMDIFLFKVVTELDTLLESQPHLHIILVPSLNDAHHDFVYPQPPFHHSKIHEVTKHQQRLHLLSNPCQFSINDIVFGISVIDVLYQLGSNECNRASGARKPRLVRLSEQLIEQRSFYPLFPPPPTGDAPIDIKFNHHFQFKHTPDILLLPSVLNRFCAKVHDSVCVNPGILSKGTSGGTYACITIFPPTSKQQAKDEDDMNITDNSDTLLPHDIPERTCIEIKRI